MGESLERRWEKSGEKPAALVGQERFSSWVPWYDRGYHAALLDEWGCPEPPAGECEAAFELGMLHGAAVKRNSEQQAEINRLRAEVSDLRDQVEFVDDESEVEL